MPEPASGLYWEELRIFLQVAQAGSFHLAAHELGMTHPTVARAVRRLETDLVVENRNVKQILLVSSGDSQKATGD